MSYPRFKPGNQVLVVNPHTRSSTGSIHTVRVSYEIGNYFYYMLDDDKDTLYPEMLLCDPNDTANYRFDGESFERAKREIEAMYDRVEPTLEVERRYNFGDLVRIKDEIGVYRIEGYIVESFHYPGETWGDVTYQLSRLIDDIYAEAEETEITLVAVSTESDNYVLKNRKKIIDEIVKDLKHEEPIPKNEYTDLVLDEYNQLRHLGDITGDSFYHQRAEEIKKKFTEGKKINFKTVYLRGRTKK